MKSSSTDDANVAPKDLLVYENLAFSTPRPDGSSCDDERGGGGDGWIEATARAPFSYSENRSFSAGPVLLNVEFFGDPSWPRILLFVPGVCESAETWTVQNLARICNFRHWRMAVLELEGHGLSEGARGVIGRSWSRCVRQVSGFCRHALAIDKAQKRAISVDDPKTSVNQPTTSRFVLAGASLGGALAAYASQAILEDEDFPGRDSFVGTLLLSPAVGVDPMVVPPPFVVTCLTLLSWVLPSVGIVGATPTEDPSHYNCPSWTNRNFKGAWPLGTSKMLLDVTSARIPNDVVSGSLNLLSMKSTPSTTTNRNVSKHAVVVISGDKDPVVPIQTVRSFVDGMKAKAREEQEQEGGTKEASFVAVTIEIIEMKKGEHSLLAQSVEDPKIGKTQKRTTNETIEHVASFLKQCEEMILVQ